MNGRRPEKTHSVSGAFVFLLLGVFAVFCVVMVLLTAKLYKDTIRKTEQNTQRMIISSYIMNTVHSADREDTFSVGAYDGQEALIITRHGDGWDDDETVYQTLLYCYQGTLYELLTDTDSEPEAGNGEAICSALAFSPVLENGMLRVNITDADGQTVQLYVRIYAEAGAML